MDTIFTDLERILIQYNEPPFARIERLEMTLPDISICAIGGFPLKIIDNKTYILNKEITRETISGAITKSLGLSGMLTYANKSNLTLSEMGKKCKQLNHLWGFNFITLTLLFSNQEKEVELSFLRDKRFYESWIIGHSAVYAFTGTIKNFKKFVSNKDDLSFDKATREAMTIIDNKFSFLWK